MRRYNPSNLERDFKGYDSFFIIQGDRINYNDIFSLKWYWLSQKINFVTIQSTDLTLYDENKNPFAFIKSTRYYKPPVLTSIYRYIAVKTYMNRLKVYTREIDEKGFFSYEGVKFYPDATVEGCGGHIFSLKDVRIEPFSLHLDMGKLFGPRLKIATMVDGDVIHSLIDFFLKQPVSPQRVLNGEIYFTPREKISKETIHLIEMLSKMAKADGIVSKEEVEVIYSLLKKNLKYEDAFTKQILKNFEQEKPTASSFKYHAREYMQINKGNHELLESTLNTLFALSLADGYLSAEEELLLKQASNIFNIRDSEYHAYLKDKDKERKKESEYYFHLLGFEQTATKEEVKNKYQMLAFKYNLNRYGDIDSELAKEMEEKFREITEAYEFLTKYCF
jgi:DnaJ like chaperone protein